MELCTTSSQFHIHQLVVLAQMALSQSTACNPTSTISLFSSVFTRSGLSWISSTTSSVHVQLSVHHCSRGIRLHPEADSFRRVWCLGFPSSSRLSRGCSAPRPVHRY